MHNALNSFTDQLIGIFMLSVIAFILGILLTPIYTWAAYKYEFWKKQRTTSTTGEAITVFNKLHAEKFKRNIPTMAGVIIVASVVIVTIFLNLDRAQTYLPLAALIGGGIVGLLDDIINIRGSGKGVAGLRSSVKFAMIIALGLALGWYFFAKLGYDSVYIPYIGNWVLGWWIIPVFVFAVVATGNAVNISDGLDGLSGGLLSISYGSFGVIALLQGNLMISGFCFTVLGAVLAYLWFNIYPARFFMGDVGSFALGTSLGVVAMLTNTLFLLPIIGALFVVEAGSSLVQIISKKFFHRRVFISAPIHHHLEAKGWPETKVTMRFWVIAAVTGFIGLLIALSGGYIN
ncbi:MAG: phospho-N-acetylmuramoyl-pentapeptide-transferase [bacterium]|nr:phospho-N-acetylmuramoyl-pentapeptide-transferase [bacterium]MDN5835169.1 phospho-N-acetylmuramoyl-pentapeptide-transferase [bacterium]